METELVVFDMDGTLFKPSTNPETRTTTVSAWKHIAESLGDEVHRGHDEMYNRWKTGGYHNSMDWVDDVATLYRESNLSRDEFESIVSRFEYREGVAETLQSLNDHNVKTAIISGGFKSQADRAQSDHDINHTFTICEFFWGDDDTLSHWNTIPCNGEGKTTFLNLLKNEYGLESDQCAFVGDGSNDVHIAQSVGTSVAFDGCAELEVVSDHVLNPEEGDTFTNLLPLLLADRR